MKKLSKLIVLGLSSFLIAGCNNSYDDGGSKGEVNTVSYTISDVALAYGWSNGVKYASFQLDSVVTVSSIGGGNTGKYYETDVSYRLYASESAQLKINVADKHAIKSVKATYKSMDGATLTGLASGVVAEAKGKEVVYPIEQTKGQVRLTAIEVSYTGEKGKDTMTKEEWSEADLAILSEKLYGVEVPFSPYKGIRIVDSEDDGVYVEAPDVTLEAYRDFYNIFNASPVWTAIDDTQPVNDAYFEAIVQTDLGPRHVIANIYVYDYNADDLVYDDGVIGNLYIDLSDPYYYEWDSALFDEIMVALNSKAVIPEVEGFSYYGVESDEDMIYAIFSDLPDNALETYVAKLTGWTITTDEGTGITTAIPATDDLEMNLAFGEHTLLMVFEKRLPHYAEFPMDIIKEYNGGVTVPYMAGATYYTAECLDIDFLGYIMQLGYQVNAYGFTKAQMDEFAATLTAPTYEVKSYEEVDETTEEQLKGYEVAMYLDSGFVYQFIIEYDSEEEAVVFIYSPKSETYSFATWAEVSTMLNEKFLTVKELVASVPELPLPAAGGRYTVEFTIDDEYEYDSFTIGVEGDVVASWTGALKTAGYTVPETPHETYGYECVDAGQIIEIDVLYDEDNNMTLAYIYSCADLAQELE